MSVSDVSGSYRGEPPVRRGLLDAFFSRRSIPARPPMAGDRDVVDDRDTVRRRLILSNVQLVAASLAAGRDIAVAGEIAADIERLLAALERVAGRRSLLWAFKRDMDVFMDRVRPDLTALRDRLADGEGAGLDEPLARIRGELGAVLALWSRRRTG